MTKTEILKEVEIQKSKLKKELQKENKTIKILDEFLNNNLIKNRYDYDAFEKIDYQNLVIAYGKTIDPSFSKEELKSLSSFYISIIQQIPNTNIKRISRIINQILMVNNIGINDIKKLQNSINLAKKLITLSKWMTKTESNTELKDYVNSDDPMTLKTMLDKANVVDLARAATIIRSKEYNLQTYLLIAKKNPKAVEKITSLISEINDLNYDSFLVKEELQKNISKDIDMIMDSKLKQKGKRVIKEKAYQDFMKSEHNTNEIIKELNKIYLYRNKLQKQETKTKKAIEKNINVYNYLIKNFLKQEQTTIVLNHHKLLDDIPNEKIKLAVLKLIYLNNYKYYKETEKTHQKLSENSVLSYQNILQKYGISKELYKDEDVMKKPIKEIERILVLMKLFGIKDSKRMVSLLTTSSSAYLNNILSLVNSGYITTQFLQDNKELLEEKSFFYDKVNKNIISLNNKNINPMLLLKDEKRWLTDNAILANNLEVLEDYDLVNTMSKTNKYNFLESTELNEVIDTVLELGFEPYLEQTLDLLNIPLNRYKRIKILNQLEEPITSLDNLIETLTTNQFFVPDDKLDNYITPEEETSTINLLKMMPLPEKIAQLNKLSQTKRTYIIDDKIYSKNKLNKEIQQTNLQKIKNK